MEICQAQLQFIEIMGTKYSLSKTAVAVGAKNFLQQPHSPLKLTNIMSSMYPLQALKGCTKHAFQSEDAEIQCMSCFSAKNRQQKPQILFYFCFCFYINFISLLVHWQSLHRINVTVCQSCTSSFLAFDQCHTISTS